MVFGASDSRVVHQLCYCWEMQVWVMRVRLSEKVLGHIVARHPEVEAYTREIVEAVRNPDLVVRGLRVSLKP